MLMTWESQSNSHLCVLTEPQSQLFLHSRYTRNLGNTKKL